MKRPALWVGLAFVAGLVLASVFVRQLWIPVCGGLTLVSLAVVLWRRTLWKYVLLGTLSCLTACCVYWSKDAAVNARQMPYAGQETTFSGTVCDVTVYPSGYARYYLNGRFEGTVPAKVELFCESPYYRYGDSITLHGTPERLQSGYLSDNAAYARTQDVFLQFGTMTEILSYTPEDHPGLRAAIGRWRSRMTERILSCMGEETGPMLTGMLFGDKTAMSRSSKQALYRMGIGHVLAVSGLHLDFLALCISWLLEKLKAGRGLRFVLMAVVCILFVIVAGETISVERACIMILIREGGRLVYRQADPLNSLSIAAFLLCVTHPFTIHGAAFWLSCTAVWGIAVLAPYMTKDMPTETFWQTAWRDFACLCWAFLATLPVCAVWFGEIALLSPLSNTLLVPVCMAAMLLGALGVCCGASGFLAELLFSGADWLCGMILRVSYWTAKLPYTHAAVSGLLLFLVIGAGILLVVGVQLLGKDKERTAYTAAAALTVTCLVLGMRQELLGSSLRAAVLGEGKSCVLAVVGGDEAVLFDMSGNSSMAAYAHTYLTENGIDRLQTLCLAKPGKKTAGRYSEYFALMPPEEVVLLKDTEDFTDVLGVLSVTDERREMLFHGAHLSAQSDCVTVEYAGMTLECCKEDAVTGKPEVLVISGKNTEALPDCGILIIPDPDSPYEPDGHTYIGETNFEVTLGRDGTCRVRRLYGDH
ncbi:MAG: competence protein ComEC family protein [Oscillospiraceae bacterium]|nr:competence protein ComEC family protein [Oscillospiraceae bacterium]